MGSNGAVSRRLRRDVQNISSSLYYARCGEFLFNDMKEIK